MCWMLTQLVASPSISAQQVVVPADVLKSYAGEYRVADTRLIIHYDDGKLYGEVPDDPRTPLIAVSDTRFEAVGAPIAFEFKQQAGKVVSVTIEKGWLKIPAQRSPSTTRSGRVSNEGVKLYYELDLPTRGTKPFPLVVLSHDSSRSSAANSMKFAKPLLERGIAVLRNDKRGVGKSQGKFSKSVSDLALAGDLESLVEFGKRQPEIDTKRIGLVGISQAGFVIPVAASRCPDVRFAIILSGTTVTVAQHNYFNQQAQDRSKDMAQLTRLLAAFELPSDPSQDFDPMVYVRRMNIPTLWLLGGQDRVVPTAETVAHIDELVRTEKKPFSRVVYPKGDHGLRDADSRRAIAHTKDMFAWLDKWVLK